MTPQLFNDEWRARVARLSCEELILNHLVKWYPDWAPLTLLKKKQLIETLRVHLLVEHFNKHYPVGSRVRWRSIADEGVPFDEWTVAHEAFVRNGQALAKLQGKSSIVSIETEFVDYTSKQVL